VVHCVVFVFDDQPHSSRARSVGARGLWSLQARSPEPGASCGRTVWVYVVETVRAGAAGGVQNSLSIPPELVNKGLSLESRKRDFGVKGGEGLSSRQWLPFGMRGSRVDRLYAA